MRERRVRRRLQTQPPPDALQPLLCAGRIHLVRLRTAVLLCGIVCSRLRVQLAACWHLPRPDAAEQIPTVVDTFVQQQSGKQQGVNCCAAWQRNRARDAPRVQQLTCAFGAAFDRDRGLAAGGAASAYAAALRLAGVAAGLAFGGGAGDGGGAATGGGSSCSSSASSKPSGSAPDACAFHDIAN